MITVLEKPKSILEYRCRFYLNLNEGRQEVCRNCFQRTLGETNDMIVSAMEHNLAEFRSKYLYIFYIILLVVLGILALLL